VPGSHQNDAALEDVAVPDEIVDLLQKVECDQTTHLIEGDVNNYVVHQALQQLHLQDTTQAHVCNCNSFCGVL
jgi:hypothetical protein